MNRTITIITAVAFVALAGVAVVNLLPDARAADSAMTQAATAEKTVTFAVEKMTCAACPITVSRAMKKVDGVKSVAVDFAAKTATVVFDPATVTPEQIGAASTGAGYPASPTS